MVNLKEKLEQSFNNFLIKEIIELNKEMENALIARPDVPYAPAPLAPEDALKNLNTRQLEALKAELIASVEHIKNYITRTGI